MRSAALLMMLVAACTLPPADYRGKTCSEACPGTRCEAGYCVPQGEALCAVVPPGLSCFDFESGTLGAAYDDTGGALRVDQTARRSGQGSLEAELQRRGGLGVSRLSLAIPEEWDRVRLGFDVFPASVELPSGTDFLSLGELLCADLNGSFTGVWLFLTRTDGGPRFVLRTSTAPTGPVLQPQISLGAWSRLHLVVDRTASRGAIVVDTEEAAVVNLPACRGRWTAEVGLAGTTPATVHYDNVVLESAP